MATAEALMTADEFALHSDPDRTEELVEGRIVTMPPADRRHGFVCLRIGRLLDQFVEENDLGRVMTNDSAVITSRDPDTVRGADVCFYSYQRLPRGPLAKGYGAEIPELVVEVRSAGDRWADLYEKVAEYLRAGVVKVVVLDPERAVAHVMAADAPPIHLKAEEELTLPGVLEGFAVRVGRFFE